MGVEAIALAILRGEDIADEREDAVLRIGREPTPLASHVASTGEYGAVYFLHRIGEDRWHELIVVGGRSSTGWEVVSLGGSMGTWPDPPWPAVSGQPQRWSLVAFPYAERGQVIAVAGVSADDAVSARLPSGGSEQARVPPHGMYVVSILAPDVVDVAVAGEVLSGGDPSIS